MFETYFNNCDISGLPYVGQLYEDYVNVMGNTIQTFHLTKIIIFIL